MKNLQVFENVNFGSVRVLGDANAPLFCASDVCNALGYKNGRENLSRWFSKGLIKCHTPTNGGIQELSYLTEAQLYKFIMRSNAKNAEAFQDWVCNEVLPSIRKNGGYILGQEQMSEAELLSQALIVANNVIERKTKELAEAQKKIEIDKPKVELFDQLMDSNTNRTIQDFVRDTKHIHKLKQKEVFQILHEKKYIFRDKKDKWCPYSSTIEKGLMQIKTSTYEVHGKTYSGQTPMVTPKGIAFFTQLLSKQEASMSNDEIMEALEQIIKEEQLEDLREYLIADIVSRLKLGVVEFNSKQEIKEHAIKVARAEIQRVADNLNALQEAHLNKELWLPEHNCK